MPSLVESSSSIVDLSRGVHALRGILGNQGKIAKKQSGKICVFLHISVMTFASAKKVLL